jgi:hypothetical protein
MIRHGADKPSVEIDLGAIGDGKVILCEAKSSSTLATSDPDEKRGTAKLITACRALTAEVLCLATSQPEWSPRTRATVQAECDRVGVTALWLEGLGTAPIAPTAASE